MCSTRNLFLWRSVKRNSLPCYEIVNGKTELDDGDVRALPQICSPFTGLDPTAYRYGMHLDWISLSLSRGGEEERGGERGKEREREGGVKKHKNRLSHRGKTIVFIKHSNPGTHPEDR